MTFRPMNGGRECPPLIENSGCFTKLCGGKELGKEASGISSFLCYVFCLENIKISNTMQIDKA